MVTKIPVESCPHKVKPFPYEWCAGCCFNGCYPWNRNPLLLCSALGGLHPTLIENDAENNPTCCPSCEPVTAEFWQSHLSDLKREAESNEDIRSRARCGGALSSEILPAEIACAKLKDGTVLEPEKMQVDEPYEFTLQGQKYIAIKRTSGKIDMYEL